ncbi:hypothetical protein BD309DRAFT_969511 [Dichomitus squalens]|nr:hypothetical protein BD309DRAFT_969511 [Dichomitus squalens]
MRGASPRLTLRFCFIPHSLRPNTCTDVSSTERSLSMPSLDSLPAELLLRIVAFLPVQTLRSLRLASRGWDAFCREHESTIYHHAALLHNFVDSINTVLSDAKSAHQRLKFLQDAPNWYHYCRMYFELQRNWLGVRDARTKFYGRHPYDVHRLKVDEEQGILITTHEFGGLTVFDLDTTEVLWRLDASYVRRHAHCEYENGFLIFDRLGAAKEVWRLASLWPATESTSTLPRVTRPTDSQLQASAAAAHAYAPVPGLDSPPNEVPKGHFRPWALIETAEFGRAYRFVYPCLLVCGLRRAFVWNVVTTRLEREFDNVQGNAGEGDINYVELSADHVFVCSTSALRIFDRSNGNMLLEIPSYQFVYSDVRIAVQFDPAVARQKVAGPGEAVRLPCEPTVSMALYTASYAEFSSVHVANDGKDLAAHLSDSRVFVIRDFMRVVRGEIPLQTAALESGKTIPRLGGTDEHFSIYLASAHGRLGLVTTSGVYAATLDPLKHGLIDEDLVLTGRRRVHGIPQSAIDAGISFPYMTFVSLPFYHDRRQLAKVTCMQMTETKLFFVWDAMYKPDNIDFFRRLGMIGGNTPSGDEHEREDDEGLLAGANITVDAATQVDAGWDVEDGVAEETNQVVVASGSGSQVEDILTETPGAGPLAVTLNAADEDEGVEYMDAEEGEEVQEEQGGHWQEDSDDNSAGSHGGVDSDSESEDDWPNVPHGGYRAHNRIARDHRFASIGPIVFCIDFSPTG